jgi:quercetin dioxygenase-like cupin family protein
MDIRRFGPGHRRPEGPPGTRGVTGTVIHQDARGLVAELAFGRHAIIAPHANPNTTLFVVIAGGGYVQVGDEGTRVNQGEAVAWPAGVAHGAYTDGTEMRAIVVELSGPDDAWARGVTEVLEAGRAGPGGAEEAPADPSTVTPGEGRLARPASSPDEHDRSQGEPW